MKTISTADVLPGLGFDLGDFERTITHFVHSTYPGSSSVGFEQYFPLNEIRLHVIIYT